MTSTLKDGWTGSVVWPGTEFLASEEGLRRWAWGGQVEEEGVPVHPAPAPPANLTRRGKRRVGVPVHPANLTRRSKRRVVEEEGLEDTFSSKEVLQTEVSRY
jgi:hypothetical protein